MGENPFDGPYGSGKTEYELYLRTPELLSLQKRPENRTHTDELLFQTMHQAEELWMKLAIHELGEAATHIDADRVTEARHAIDRVARIIATVERNLRLFETMLPSAYIDIRKGLGGGSGLDSPGFNRLNEIAPSVYARFEKLLERRGTDILEVYDDPASHPDLLDLAEILADIDAGWTRFKREHIMVVRRIIGLGTASLRGNPVEMLERSANLTWFPMIWAVRDRLFIDFKAGPKLTKPPE